MRWLKLDIQKLTTYTRRDETSKGLKDRVNEMYQGN